MSFLSVLLVASAFYLANARPDQPTPELGAPVRAKVKVPEDYSVTMDPRDHQHQLYDLMNEMTKAVDKYLTPIMSKLDSKKQNDMKNMCLNGFSSYINYLLLLIQEIQNEKSEDGTSKFYEGFSPRQEMVLEFSAPQKISTPFMAEFNPEDEHEAE